MIIVFVSMASVCAARQGGLVLFVHAHPCVVSRVLGMPDWRTTWRTDSSVERRFGLTAGVRAKSVEMHQICRAPSSFSL